MRRFSVIDAPQRSEAWVLARLGRLTGSRAADMLATKGSGEAAGRRNLRMQLVLERVTGKPQERVFQSAAMQHGVDTEPAAYGAYEALTGSVLQTTGFLSHTEYLAGASLDGHSGDFDGLVEIKCPIPATHWEYLKTGTVPSDYLKQITHALWLTGAQWCDWMSYEPSFPERLQAKLVRVNRADVDLGAYEKAALAFLAEVETEYNAVMTLAGGVAAMVA